MTGSKWAITSQEEDAGVLMAVLQKGQGLRRCWENRDKIRQGGETNSLLQSQKFSISPATKYFMIKHLKLPNSLEFSWKVPMVIQGVEN